MSILATFVLALAAPIAEDGEWVELQFDNGIRATIITAADAEAQATFTFVPLGLLDDDAGCTQFAHLVEHMAVRSNDPQDRMEEEILINGETMAGSMRLETLAPVEHWRSALARHAAWLAPARVDPRVLEREKGRIAAEVQSTAAEGFTHKWALAAWNQVVRHGATHVRVTGDVVDASPQQAFEYLRDRLRPGSAVHVVTVGPVPVAKLRAAMEHDFGALEAREWRTSVPSVPVETITGRSQLAATWDLPDAHYLEWYPVPSATAADRVAADALALLLNVRLQQRGSLKALGAQALATADLVTPEGRWLLITVSLPAGVDVQLALGIVRQVVDGLAPMPEAELLIKRMAEQLVWPDFGELRKQFADQPGLQWLEAQQALFQMYAQMNIGLDREALLAAYQAFAAADLAAFAHSVLVEGNRSNLVLTPRGDD